MPAAQHHGQRQTRRPAADDDDCVVFRAHSPAAQPPPPPRVLAPSHSAICAMPPIRSLYMSRCPISSSPRTKVASISGCTSTGSSTTTWRRIASAACSGLAPKSIKRCAICADTAIIRRPPGSPMPISRSGRRTIIGAVLLSGRLWGATELAPPGRGSSRHIPCASRMPVPSTTSPEPRLPPWVIVAATTLPSASAVDRCRVSGTVSLDTPQLSRSTRSGVCTRPSTRPAA